MELGKWDHVQSQIDYKFKNLNLLEQAFTRRSYSKENGGENNEVLEFIGDKVLDFVVVKLLAEKYGEFDGEFVSEYSEGKLTDIKKKLVCRKMLAKRISCFGFQYEMLLGRGDIKNEVYEEESVQEDLFEAIVGAVALDCDWDMKRVAEVVDLMLEPEFYLENGFDDEEDYVALLQQWYQKKYNRIPWYCFRVNMLHGFYVIENPNNNGRYLCSLGLSPIEKGFEGVGNSKSEARWYAAKKAYEYLEEKGLLYSLSDEVGEPCKERAINQLQELYQKGYIGEPTYKFSETYDSDGNPEWKCECHVEGRESFWYGTYSSKKQGKKEVAFDMLCEIFDEED